MRSLRIPALFLAVLTALLCAVPAAGEDLLIRIDRQGPQDKELLLERDFKVAAEMSGSLYLFGGDDVAAALEKYGFVTEIIDPFPGLSDYYFVGLRDDSDREAVGRAGEIVYSEENLVLLRVPAGYQLASLYDAKVFVTPLGRDGMKKPLFEDETPVRRESMAAQVPLVTKMVGEVSPASIDSYWETVVNNLPEGTRNSTSQGCYDASDFVLSEFQALGLKSESIPHTGGHAPNTEGEITGAVNPSVIYIIEGHLDDMPSSGPAPGADDNASGSVAVLEAARVLSCYPFKKTVRFLTVTGEEYGLYGSTDYANDARAAGENIQGVLNFDMPGWAGNGSPNPEDLDLNYNADSQGLGEFFADCATEYSTGLAVDAFLCPSLTASDHYGFWQNGYKAVCGITDNEGYCGHSGNYPYYHTVNDTIANCGDKTFFYSVVRTGVAALAELGEPFRITFDKTAYSCSGTLQIILGDRDLNTSALSQQSVSVPVRSTIETTPEMVTLFEDGLDSMIFRGTIGLSAAAPAHGDGFLSVGAGSVITADYIDISDCGGAVNVPYTASAPACTPPLISNVQIASLSARSVTITWTTNIQANSRVTYGTSVPPALNQDDLSAYVTSHSVTIDNLSDCSRYYFSVTSTDEGGNTASEDNGGSFFTFDTSVRIYNYGPDTVESGTGIWTASGDAGSIWHRDTCKAYSGSYSWKAGANDSPTCTANYGTSDLTDLTSSTISLGAPGHGYHLRFNEWYSTESSYDFCTVMISTTGGTSWTDLGPARSGSSGGWVQRDYDLAAYSGDIKLKFRLTSDNYSNSLGWFIDDIEVSYDAVCAPVLDIESSSFTDDCVGTGSGDGDGYLDAGEEGTITVTLKNNGYFDATNVRAELSTETPGVTVVDVLADFPDIAIGASGTSIPGHFKIRLAETVACGTVIQFDLASGSNEGSSAGTMSLEVGHWSNPVTNLLAESFDVTTFPPTGWSEVNVLGTTADWLRSTNTVLPAGGGTHSGAGLAYVRATTSNNSRRLYRTSGSAIPSSAVSAQVSFWMYHDTGAPTKTDSIKVQVSTDGTTWVLPGNNQFLRNNGTTGWQQHSVDLSAYIGQSIRIGFLGTWMGGNYCHMDDVVFSYQGAAVCLMNPCAPSLPAPPEIAVGLTEDDSQSWSEDKDTQSWPVSPTATGYRLYRGTYDSLQYLLNSNDDSCKRYDGTSTSIDLSSDDPSGVAGRFYWYLVTAYNGAGEGTPGAGRTINTSGVCAP